MKNSFKIIFFVSVILVLFVPVYNVKADPTSTVADELKKQIENQKQIEDKDSTEEEKKVSNNEYSEDDCSYIFGPDDESSTMFMIQRFLNYAKVIAPLLVILLSGFDFAKTALTGDSDDMKKAGKKLGIRLGCAVGVFLAPLLAGFIIDFINNKSAERTCKIK